MMKMKFITDAGEIVMQTMNKNMAYFNLPPRMIEHWQYAHELNRTLVDLVEFLALDHRASRRSLNPTAALNSPTTLVSIDGDAKLNENKGNGMPWKRVPSKECKNKRNNNSKEKGEKVHVDINRCSRLSEMLSDDE